MKGRSYPLNINLHPCSFFFSLKLSIFAHSSPRLLLRFNLVRSWNSIVCAFGCWRKEPRTLSNCFSLKETQRFINHAQKESTDESGRGERTRTEASLLAVLCIAVVAFRSIETRWLCWNHPSSNTGGATVRCALCVCIVLFFPAGGLYLCAAFERTPAWFVITIGVCQGRDRISCPCH